MKTHAHIHIITIKKVSSTDRLQPQNPDKQAGQSTNGHTQKHTHNHTINEHAYYTLHTQVRRTDEVQSKMPRGTDRFANIFAGNSLPLSAGGRGILHRHFTEYVFMKLSGVAALVIDNTALSSRPCHSRWSYLEHAPSPRIYL